MSALQANAVEVHPPAVSCPFLLNPRAPLETACLYTLNRNFSNVDHNKGHYKTHQIIPGIGIDKREAVDMKVGAEMNSFRFDSSNFTKDKKESLPQLRLESYHTPKYAFSMKFFPNNSCKHKKKSGQVHYVNLILFAVFLRWSFQETKPNRRMSTLCSTCVVCPRMVNGMKIWNLQ